MKSNEIKYKLLRYFKKGKRQSFNIQELRIDEGFQQQKPNVSCPSLINCSGSTMSLENKIGTHLLHY